MGTSVAQYKEMVSQTKKKKHKYNAKRAEADGVIFASMGERDCYLYLKDFCKRINGQLHRQIPLRYRLGNGPWHALIIDFMITWEKNQVYYVDFKGKVLDSFLHKKEAVEAFYPGLTITYMTRSKTSDFGFEWHGV